MATATTKKRGLFDELRFADFPHELAGQEGLDKYTIRAWLIGWAVLRGCTYEPDDDATSGHLRRTVDGIAECVTVRLVPGGVMIDSELIETAR